MLLLLRRNSQHTHGILRTNELLEGSSIQCESLIPIEGAGNHVLSLNSVCVGAGDTAQY